MGAEPTVSGWSLHDRSRTNAEVILDLYKRIRETGGQKTLILGCNTIGHLAQGRFDIQRTGDDTSVGVEPAMARSAGAYRDCAVHLSGRRRANTGACPGDRRGVPVVGAGR
jgi:hypothetical protein